MAPAAPTRDANATLASYQAIHARVVGRLRRNRLHGTDRVVIFVARDGRWGPGERLSGGIADRMTGMMTAYAISLATDAAFLVDWPGLHHYFDSPLDLWYNASRELGTRHLNELPGFCTRNYTRVNYARFVASANSSGVTLVRASRGIIGSLSLKGPEPPLIRKLAPVKAMLESMGLTLATAYSTLFHSVLRPSTYLRETFEPIRSVLEQAQIRIMIQIRAGDEYITGSSSIVALPPHLRSFFDCAAQVEIHASPNKTAGPEPDTELHSGLSDATPRVVWFLMTDSADVRRHALKSSHLWTRARIVTNLDSQPIFYEDYDKDRQGMHDPLLDVFGEQWLGSLCNRWVVSAASGLGMQAAFRSLDGDMLDGNLHVLDNHLQGHRTIRNGSSNGCWPPTPLPVAAHMWSQI